MLNFIIFFLVGISGTLLVLWFILFVIFKDDELYGTGIKTEAKIISMKESGRSNGGNIRFIMTVEFQTKNGIVTTTAKQFLSITDLLYVKENKTIPVWYDKENPQRIFIAPVDIPHILEQ
ncbi:hypothetical protein ROK90_08020 [Cronobacter dublinensis]|uniref:DUF3592 domain-containing protein n=1 Tax=Cronobacter dublinensis TaxID=413497 RepID=UPI0023DD06BB|nr:DUF3592 domain-containing protein [Cronobacter dublinensis]MDT3665961.1 hypothetical protein [Cronobacter dublinensis]WEP45934.1 DUF3592 domain-containing protein [Cronobacter dublinensis]